MKDFYDDFGFIIGFMIMCLLVLMAFGEKAEKSLLIITLLSMVLINSETVVSFMDKNFKAN